jgi:hypothetical protein
MTDVRYTIVMLHPIHCLVSVHLIYLLTYYVLTQLLHATETFLRS